MRAAQGPKQMGCALKEAGLLCNARVALSESLEAISAGSFVMAQTAHVVGGVRRWINTANVYVHNPFVRASVQALLTSDIVPW